MNCLLDVLTHKVLCRDLKSPRTPIWFMRQAGRYLPEYKKLRSNFSSFMEFVHTPDAACEATLQPLKRFDLDAAIIFSDILVIPDALGQKVQFTPGEGPKLAPFRDVKDLNFDEFEAKIAATLKAIALVKNHLEKEATKKQQPALIGFSGAPWTLACYMLEGAGSKNYDALRSFAAANFDAFVNLMALLTEATARYLVAQAKAGADVLKIFDSWAGYCPAWLTEIGILLPVRTIIERVRQEAPGVPIMYFPRLAGERYAALAFALNADGVALDQFVDPSWVNVQFPAKTVVQGGLDPMIMKAGGEILDQEIDRYLKTFSNRPYIFNMGHGMVPDMPIDHVSQAIDRVRAYDAEI